MQTSSDLKAQAGRSAFMGGASPVLYRPVVPARPVKISADAQFSAPAQIFTISCEKAKNSISASKCPITSPKIRT
jgi:hypothetical protein